MGKEQARQILKDGILNMSIERLIQMSDFGLMGNIILLDEVISVENVFNCISYKKETNNITFSVQESQGSYGLITFSLDAIVDISGCEDKENPEEYLNVKIKLKNGMAVGIRILY